MNNTPTRTRRGRSVLGVASLGPMLAALLVAPVQASGAAGAATVPSASVDTVAGPDFCQGRGKVDPLSREVGALAVDAAGRVFFDTGQAGAVGYIAPDGGASLRRGVPAAATANDARSPLASSARMAPGSNGSFFLATGGRIVEINIGLATVAGDPMLAPGAVGEASSGDGGPFAEARFLRVLALASDDEGNLYAAEEIDPREKTSRIRFLNRGGTPIVFYPGTPQELTVAPGAIATIVEGEGRLGSGDNTAARNASLQGTPPALAVVGSRLYIALSTGMGEPSGFDATVRLVNLGGQPLPAHGITVAPGAITTVAGGQAGTGARAPLSYLSGIAADTQNNVFLAEEASHRVLRLDDEGALTVFAGLGRASAGFNGNSQPATSARLDRPADVAIGPDGRVYISDRGNGAVRFVDSSGIIRAAGGEGLARTSTCLGPSGSDGGQAGSPPALPDRPLAVGSAAEGDIYIATETADRVKRVDGTGIITELDSTVSPGATTVAQLGAARPTGVAIRPDDGLYVIHSGVEGAAVVNLGSDPIRAHGDTLEPGQVRHVGGQFPAGSGQTGLVAELLPGASAVASDDSGNVYIGSFARVEMLDASGAVSTLVDSPQPRGCCRIPAGLAVDHSGNVYVSDKLGNQVWYLNRGSAPVTVHGVPVSPGALAVVVGDGSDGFGGDSGPATQAQLRMPAGLAVDTAGNLYIADFSEHTVRRVDSRGIIDTVAGTGRAGFNGDGLDGRLTALSGPTSLAFDRCGNLLIADYGNGRVRRLNLVGNCPSASVAAGQGRAGWSRSAVAAASAVVLGGITVVGLVLTRRRRVRLNASQV